MLIIMRQSNFWKGGPASMQQPALQPARLKHREALTFQVTVTYAKVGHPEPPASSWPAHQ